MFKSKVIVLIGTLAVSWAALSQESQLGGERTAKWPIPDKFKVKRSFVKYGKPTDNGLCVFESKISARPGETIEEVELEYDPLTCRSLVVQGNSEETIELINDPLPNPSKLNEQPLSSAETEHQPKAASETTASTYWASFETWFIDPVWLTLNSVESKVWWRPLDECASGEYNNFQANYDWLKTTGWFRVSKTEKKKADCTGVSLNTSAIFQSDSFPSCDIGTQAKYKENYVFGSPSGVSGYSKTERIGKEFLCTDLWRERKRLKSGSTGTNLFEGQYGCPGEAPALFYNIEVPYGNKGKFSGKTSGSDYDGSPLYMQVNGSITSQAVIIDLNLYEDAAQKIHIRTDRCSGTFNKGVFLDDSCSLIKDTTAECVPTWTKLTKQKSSSSKQNIGSVPLPNHNVLKNSRSLLRAR